MKTIKKDECSYSVSNAIRTLAMLRLEVEEENARAVHVYKKSGFEFFEYKEMKKE